MTKRVLDLQDARRKKRRQGWSLSEIAKRAAEERTLYEKIGSAESADLASGGDIKKILEEPPHDDRRVQCPR